MHNIQAPQQGKLIRTTVRLSQPIYKRAKQLSLDAGESLQQIIADAIVQFDQDRARSAAADILKYTVRLKPGTKLPTRSEFYEEYLDRKFPPLR